MASDLTRRGFCTGAAAAGAMMTLGPIAGCDTEQGINFEDVPPGQVFLVRAETPEAAVARGVELMGAFSFIEPGQRVMLKPNMTGPIWPPDITSPAVLQELIRQCREAGAGEVVVAERTFYEFTTEGVFTAPFYDRGKSMLELIEEAGAVFRPLDDEDWVEVLPEGADDFEEPFLIPALVNEVDHLINVPALKTHNLADFTMTMKNFFGLIHPDTRTAQVHDHPLTAENPDRIKRMFAQLNLAFDPIVNVMDAIISRTTGGPTPPGDQADTNMILLGRDRVAMDAVGLAVLKVYGTEPHIEDRPVWQQVQLAEAVRVGVGVSGPDEITLVGDGVDELDEIDVMLREV